MLSSRLRAVVALAGLLVANPVAAQPPSPLACRTRSDDRIERPAPDALLPRLGRTFGVAPITLRHGAYIRCAEGALMGCMIGANLNCGKADVSRHSAGADAFCRENTDAQVVPMSSTGHDTVYAWHCVGSHAVAGETVEQIDRLGFMTRNWRVVR